LPATHPSDPLSYKVVGTKRELKRGEASLLIFFPLMQRIHLHIMERGIKGVRLLKSKR